MTLRAAIGHAQALDGREAGLQAAHQALNRLGSGQPTLAILIASHQYDGRQVVSGVSSLLGEIPTVGFSSPASLTGEGQQPNSVVVALLQGNLEAGAVWLPGYAQSARETAARLAQSAPAGRTVLLFADGFNGDAEQLCAALPSGGAQLVGALSSGDLHTGHNYQIAGAQSSGGGLAALWVDGPLRVGVGAAHGWQPVGNLFRVTRSRGFWLRTLDGRPASETYAQVFGHPAREWAFPPLNYLARLYPLGVTQGDELLVRAPLRVEADGSFRMNAQVRDGLDAYLMVGSGAACRQAATRAAEQALAALGGAQPAFALLLVDIGWQMLLKAMPGAEVAAVREVLGASCPLAGGYTLGQIVPGRGGAPQFLNQHLVVIAFAEETA